MVNRTPLVLFPRCHITYNNQAVPGKRSVLDYTNNDTWAVGLIAHGILSPDGQEPFGAQGDVMLYASNEYQDIPACYPPVLGDVVRGLLAVDPQTRLSAGQAIDMLEELIGAGGGGGEGKEGYEGKEGKNDKGDRQDLKGVLAVDEMMRQHVETLSGMGFTQEQAVNALKRSSSIEAAIAWLMSQ